MKLAIIFSLIVTNAYSYGPRGHRMVGAVADQLLAGKPAATKMRAMLEGLNLQQASTLADEIKEWDGETDNKQRVILKHQTGIEKQLKEFWKANPPFNNDSTTRPSHHWFHYADVPVESKGKYADGNVGRSKWDIVHMIHFCISVLTGTTPETNSRTITKPIAVILLAHFLGDIHQPLHVGAEFFDANGKTCDAEKKKPAFGDHGGSSLNLVLAKTCNPGKIVDSLHRFWDHDAVDIAFPTDSVDTTGCNPLPKIILKSCAETWANESLRNARKAHSRLLFAGIKIKGGVATGNAIEMKSKDGMCYKDWAAQSVREQITKAGRRLAALLEKVIK